MSKPKLTVVFENLSRAWVDFSIRADDQVLSDSISCIFPVLSDLCTVLAAVAGGLETRPVVFLAEPVEYELHFLPDRPAQATRFVVHEWPDSRRSALFEPKTRLAMEGKPLEIVLPFWRALRSLQASLPDNDTRRSERLEFPDWELQKLTGQLESLRAREETRQVE